MRPNVGDVLQGLAVAVTSPAAQEAGADYAASRAGMLAMLAGLAVQEADRAGAAALAENAAIRALFAQALAHDASLGGRLGAAARETESDFALSALDGANARLRRLLIELHERVENAGDRDLDGRILELYAAMARGRRLQMPGG
ncbi:MAG TPA: hypothetical protein VMU93_03295 [Caulobacteraceae bacterium]|nr:hypothetical protein [Caulobacteraceae bacterium]